MHSFLATSGINEPASIKGKDQSSIGMTFRMIFLLGTTFGLNFCSHQLKRHAYQPFQNVDFKPSELLLDRREELVRTEKGVEIRVWWYGLFLRSYLENDSMTYLKNKFGIDILFYSNLVSRPTLKGSYLVYLVYMDLYLVPWSKKKMFAYHRYLLYQSYSWDHFLSPKTPLKSTDVQSCIMCSNILITISSLGPNFCTGDIKH